MTQTEHDLTLALKQCQRSNNVLEKQHAEERIKNLKLQELNLQQRTENDKLIQQIDGMRVFIADMNIKTLDAELKALGEWKIDPDLRVVGE